MYTRRYPLQQPLHAEISLYEILKQTESSKQGELTYETPQKPTLVSFFFCVHQSPNLSPPSFDGSECSRMYLKGRLSELFSLLLFCDCTLYCKYPSLSQIIQNNQLTKRVWLHFTPTHGQWNEV